MSSHPQVLSSGILFLGIILGKLCAWPCEFNIWERWDRVIVRWWVFWDIYSPPLLPFLQPLGIFLSAMAPPMYEGYQTDGHHSFLYLAGRRFPTQRNESVNADESFKSHMHHSREGKGEN